MDSGRCRRCGRPFTAGEVTGMGVLRARPAAAGGPVVEFTCPGCRTVLPLVPHGNGRYAPPGAEPPPPPTAAERTVPWRRAGPGGEPRAKDPIPPVRTEARPPPPPPPEPPPPRGSEPTASPPPAERPTNERPAEAPLDLGRALEILGVAETASPKEIEKAYRLRALQCHPDKVSHLDPEFVALAEQKFRRLQAARDFLLGAGAG